MPQAEKLAAVRDGLPATGAGIYLDTPVCGPLPAETARAMADIADWELTTGRAHRDREEDVAVRIDEARAGLAAILGADVDGVELTHGTMDGLRRAVGTIDWRPGDRALVISTGDFVASSALRPPIADVELDAIELSVEPDSVDDGALLAEVSAAMRPTTRLLACPHVSTTGRILPLERLSRLAHDAGALVVIDGSQAAGAIPVSIDDLGPDVYVVPGWSWLLGPEGIGGIVVRASPGDRNGAPGAAGEFHLPSVVGLARSCGWLSMYVGLEWIFERSASLATFARERLAAVPGVQVLAGGGPGAPTIAFRIPGWQASSALDELGSRAFALASVLPAANAIAIGTGFFNTEEELDRFVAAVELLATHTPHTLPPRRQLTIIGGDR
jgi:cysteine desulfurase/selenocysteine lyase